MKAKICCLGLKAGGSALEASTETLRVALVLPSDF